MDEAPLSGHEWLNPPASWSLDGGRLTARSKPGSDFWRKTKEGFVKDDGHLFGRAVEGDFGARVRFAASLAAQYDQAGLMIRASPERWIKCGVELAGGKAYASVVVTDDYSDWSLTALADLPGLVELEVTRQGDAVEVRCLRPLGSLLRVAPWRHDGASLVGPMCASPVGPGFEVSFEGFVLAPRMPERLPAGNHSNTDIS